MKKLILALCVLLAASPAFATTGGTKPLSGTYPIVLVHGILGFDDSKGLAAGLLTYWGGQDDYLRDQGAAVLTPGLTAMNNNQVRGQQLKDQVNQWMAAYGMTKVHLMGHSQGGLTSRYMTTNLGMKSKIASITTINSVHRGTPTADIGLAVIPNWLEPFVGTVLNFFGKLVYGSQQDIIEMAKSLTTGAMSKFNGYTPNASGVKYFSYGSQMFIEDLIQHPLMGIVYPITWTGGVFNGQGGANDGVVPVSSQKWGTWKGFPEVPWYSTGVDHLQATNFQYTGQIWYDVDAYYLKMAKNAKANQ